MSCATNIWAEDPKNGIKVDLENLTLNKDKDGYFLSVEYRTETAADIRKIRIPNMRLPINTHWFMMSHERGFYDWDTFTACDIGFGHMRLDSDKNGCQWYCEIIEEKTKEMTLEEIEKKLGHKVKIVSKE